MTAVPDAAGVIETAAIATADADAAFAKAKADFAELEGKYRELKGRSAAGDWRGLLKKYGPGLATYFGIPGAASALTALAADDGAFDTVTGLVNRLLGG